MVHFFSIWGIYSALAYDYHDSVPAAMIVPWILYYFKIEKYKGAIICFVLLIICRENMALWGGFIALGLFVKNYKNKKKRNLLHGLSLFSFSFFVIVIHYIMPAIAIQPDIAYLHFKFPPLGSNFKEAIVNIFKHPWDIFIAFR